MPGDDKMKSAYCLLKLLHENIPFFPLAYFNYYFLEFSGIPKKKPTRFDGQIIQATEKNLKELIQTFQQKAKKFSDRLDHNQIIILARDLDGRIVGYENLDLSSEHLESHSGIVIKIPPNSIYLYDAYILPEYRLKGVWIGFKNKISEIMVEHNRRRLFTFVDYENSLSLKSHLQFGFKIYENRKIWKIFGKPFCFTYPVQHDLNLIRALLNH